MITIEQIFELFDSNAQSSLTRWGDDYEQVNVPKGLKKLWKTVCENNPNIDFPEMETFWRRFHLAKQLDKMAYPLSSKAILFIQQRALIEDGESFPQFPYLITTLTSLLARQWCIWGIQTYLEVFKGNDATLNTNIVKTLYAPTDNQWWALLTGGSGVLKWLSKQQINSPVHTKLIQTFQSINKTKPTWNEQTERDANGIQNVSSKGKPQPIKTVADLVKFLLRYRNALIHAEPLTSQDTDNAALALECLLQASLPLNPFVLRSKIGQNVYELQGMFPTVNNDYLNQLQELNDRDLVLYCDDTQVFSLSPLMTLASNIEVIDEAEDIFFINKGSIQSLKYVGFVNGEHKDGQTLGSYDSFKKYLSTIPIPPGGTDNPVIDFTDFAADKNKYFVGRSAVLDEIHAAISSNGGQYLFLKALAGMGKSAIMANLYQTHHHNTEDDETEEEAQEDDSIWIFHFCMHTNGRDQALTAYRSLITQLQIHLGTYNKKRKPSMDIKELKEQFQTLLNGAGEKLEKLGKKRIVVALDALDETSFVEEDSIITCLPDFIQDHVTILCSYRVADDGSNQRVESRLQHLPNEKCIVLTNANPLSGLSKQDVRDFLQKVGQGVAPSDTMHETVWAAASKDLLDFADPFYLRFVADGVEKRQYFLTRPETIPTSLNGAFEQMWLALPSDKNFLAHRLLVTLGIMRDLGDDELFAELFSRQFNETFSLEDIATIRRPIGKLLSYDGDRYGLFHDRFRYFLVGEQKDPIAEALAVTT